MSGDVGLYVYGLIPAGQGGLSPDVAGVDGSGPVRTVVHGQVAAIVSDVALSEFDDEPLRGHLADMSWVERTARGHQGVLDAVIEHCTPIPMRLCTLYRDEQGLREMLAREHDQLTAGLMELSDKLEWGVKVFAARVPASIATTAESAGGAPATGTDYLKSRLSAGQRQDQIASGHDQVCAELHSRLTAASSAARLGALQRPEASGRDAPMVLSAFYLVPNRDRDEFERQVAAPSDELMSLGLEVELSGPWPPYNFVPPSIGGGL